MESTSSRNTLHNYIIEQKQNEDILSNRIFHNYAFAYDNVLPCRGIHVGQMPNSTLSNNPIDIENQLFGINTKQCKYNKFVKLDYSPSAIHLPSVTFYNQSNKVILPDPLVIENNQRPVRP